MSKLDNVIKELNKKLKNDIITMDKDAITFNSKDSVHFLSPSLEYMFHGEGFKTNTLWTIRGEYSSAKTSLSHPMRSIISAIRTLRGAQSCSTDKIPVCIRAPS